MNDNGVSKKVLITTNVFSGLLGAMATAETSPERIVMCSIIAGCFALFMGIQGYIDCKKEKAGEKAEKRNDSP